MPFDYNAFIHAYGDALLKKNEDHTTLMFTHAHKTQHVRISKLLHNVKQNDKPPWNNLRKKEGTQCNNQ